MPLYNYTKIQKHKKQSAKEKQKREIKDVK
jgi:hypothetical protein